MSIVSSVVVDATTQADGSLRVDEQHTDNLGEVYNITYQCAAGTNTSAMLSQHAAVLAQSLAASDASMAKLLASLGVKQTG